MFATAKRADRIALILSHLAIVAFLLMGTLASLPALHDQAWVANGLHYLPFVLIGLSMPFSLCSAFLLWRLRVSQGKTLVLIFVSAMVLFLFGSYFGMAAWLGIPWVLKWNIAAFEKFLLTQPQGDSAHSA